MCCLVAAGHSLGAGVASIIALKLRDRFPQTQVLGLLPPRSDCHMYMVASIHSHPTN